MGGSRRKYTKQVLTEVVARSNSVAEVLRRLDLAQAGGTHAHISRTIKAYGIDTSHFGSKPYPNGADRRRRTAQDILVRVSPGSRRVKPTLLHRALTEIGRPYECALCGLDGTWLGSPLRLEIDHVDGDYHNNEPWNLRFLCPNCHSQTDSLLRPQPWKVRRSARAAGALPDHACASPGRGLDSAAQPKWWNRQTRGT